MAKVLRYTSGGRTFDMNEGSAAQKLAAADGQFELVGEVAEDGIIEGPAPAAIDDIEPATVVYTEADAIAQNDGKDESTADARPAKNRKRKAA